jgi:DNA-binding GntR family transcriptional regulator
MQQPPVEIERGDARPDAFATDLPSESKAAVLQTDEVYARLRHEIAMGILKPRQALSEAELAQRLGVSRTPIRESIQRLRSDGLVISHRRRWLVYAHTRKEIKDIFEVRMALEGYAARLSCERASDSQVAELVTAASHDASAMTVPQFMEANTAFHAAIIDGSDNHELQALVARNLGYSFNARLMQTYTADDIREGMGEHQKIAASIRRRDADEAEALAREHVAATLRFSLERVAWA